MHDHRLGKNAGNSWQLPSRPFSLTAPVALSGISQQIGLTPVGAASTPDGFVPAAPQDIGDLFAELK